MALGPISDGEGGGVLEQAAEMMRTETPRRAIVFIG